MTSRLALMAIGAMSAPAGVAVAETINGTRHADSLTGTRGDDRFSAFGGHDFVAAQGGNDTVYTGCGNDVVEADAERPCSAVPGTTLLLGGMGDDRLRGRHGSGVVEGG